MSGAKREPKRAGLNDLFAGIRAPAAKEKSEPKPEKPEKTEITNEQKPENQEQKTTGTVGNVEALSRSQKEPRVLNEDSAE